MASVARRYNRQPGERSQAWWRTVDNTSLCRLTQAGRCQQTWAVVSDIAVVHARPRTTGGCGASGRNVSVVRRQGRDTSERPRPRVAPSADHNIHGPRRLRGVTSASRNVERRHVSERRDVSEPQRQRTATTAWRDVSEPQRRARQRAA